MLGWPINAWVRFRFEPAIFVTKLMDKSIVCDCVLAVQLLNATAPKFGRKAETPFSASTIHSACPPPSVKLDVLEGVESPQTSLVHWSCYSSDATPGLGARAQTKNVTLPFGLIGNDGACGGPSVITGPGNHSNHAE